MKHSLYGGHNSRLTAAAGYAHINMSTDVDDVSFKWVTDLHHVCPNFLHSSLYNDKFTQLV